MLAHGDYGALFWAIAVIVVTVLFAVVLALMVLLSPPSRKKAATRWSPVSLDRERTESTGNVEGTQSR